jgi:hypothetical protein
MFSQPATVFGTPARARGNAQSTREASVLVPLHGCVVARATFLRWNLADFEVSDEQLNALDGWFLTIAMEIGAARLHLSQGSGVFWTTNRHAHIQAIDAEDVGLAPTPNWARRSNRLWPHLDGAPMPFLGQAFTSAHHVYLFGDTADVVVHLDHRNEQDVEEHYDREA